MREMLREIAANGPLCASFYLDTIEAMSSGGEDHAQGLARTHLLSDKKTVYFFQSNSHINGLGTISQYRYVGPVDGEHVKTDHPTMYVALMTQLMSLVGEDHPSDIVFLPELNHLDAGYLFVAAEYGWHNVAVYYWEPGKDLLLIDKITQNLSNIYLGSATPKGPNLLLLDRVGDTYFLGAASTNWGNGYLFTASADALFPDCKPGGMNVSAFALAPSNALASHATDGHFDLPVGNSDSPSQTKLVRDSSDAWYMLAFRSDPSADDHGTDYIDAYPVQFSPFAIITPPITVHVVFPPGETGFASTGTHYVDAAGRLLVSSSYRWSENEGPGGSAYVSRVDECPSS